MTEPLDAWLDRQHRAAVADMRKPKPRQPREAKAKRGTPERDQQRAVVGWLRKAGCIVAASVNDAPADARDPEKRARFYAARARAGVLKGWPDLCAITRDGRVFWIEMKAAKGKPTDAQAALHADMRARGCVVIVARDVWSAQDGLKAAGIVL
jgi:hypothetical protein